MTYLKREHNRFWGTFNLLIHMIQVISHCKEIIITKPLVFSKTRILYLPFEEDVEVAS